MRLQSREDLIADLQSKKFRDAFVSSRVSNTLALQIRAMRQERGWSQAYLAELLGTSQNAVWRLESPQYGKYSTTTLKRLASIFDVGLAVWLVPFSKLVDRVTHLSTDDILVPSFDNDSGLEEVAADFEGDTTQRNPFQVSRGVVTQFKNTSRLDTMPFIAPKHGEKKVSGGVTYDRAGKDAA
ncbi:MAG: helix-turn-helix transcriptional regulator [Candidatus Entotheonellia bacterium]